METAQTVTTSTKKSRVVLVLAGLFIIFITYHWFKFSYFNLTDLIIRIISTVSTLGVFIFKAQSRGYRISKIIFIIVFILAVISGPLVNLINKHLIPAVENSLIGKLGKQAQEEK